MTWAIRIYRERPERKRNSIINRSPGRFFRTALHQQANINVALLFEYYIFVTLHEIVLSLGISRNASVTEKFRLIPGLKTISDHGCRQVSLRFVFFRFFRILSSAFPIFSLNGKHSNRQNCRPRYLIQHHCRIVRSRRDLATSGIGE